ncbi:S41 family peptidase [Acidisoma cladoniae]|jgi:carboxyl-terminal processing protease|uniref:S41 family peptidase n=1 Tax=Acidisoma cladoniae TaxID=3040935 RepID=UPI0025509720|nr:S41 family peptidase [Acidisoma sp. PAMC 29798]
MKLRSGLLLGTAFIAGLSLAPLSDVVLHRFGATLGIGRALAAEDPVADAFPFLSLFGDVYQTVKADYVEPVKDQPLIENAINGMLSGLDPHSAYMNAKQYRDMQAQTDGEFGGLGLEVTQENGFIKVISPIDGTPASKAKIKPNDLILEINGKSVQGLSLDDAVDMMRGAPGSTIALTLKQAASPKPQVMTLTREVINVPSVHQSLYGDVGYIRLSVFSENADQGIRDAVTKLQAQSHGKIHGYVLDLRNNPGGLLDQAVAVANDFMNHGEIVSTRARHPKDSQVWNAKPDGDIVGNAPLVVMINPGSASASEIVSGALQDNRRAIVLGLRSFGKGSVQTVIQLPGDSAMRLTTARYYTPSGRSIQELGITPDVPVASSDSSDNDMQPLRESDLQHAMLNPNSKGLPPLPPRTDLPSVVKDIPKVPPAGWAKFDPAKPTTDFQLQQALKVVDAMPATVASN